MTPTPYDWTAPSVPKLQDLKDHDNWEYRRQEKLNIISAYNTIYNNFVNTSLDYLDGNSLQVFKQNMSNLNNYLNDIAIVIAPLEKNDETVLEWEDWINVYINPTQDRIAGDLATIAV